MRKPFHIVSFHICVPLTVKQWQVLDTLDFDDVNRAIKGTGVEYNNHFGRFVWFNVDNEKEAGQSTEALLALVNGPKGPLTKQCCI